jgi:hypothetical protein
MKVWNDFVPERLFRMWETEVRAADYSGTVNPVDGVEYPDVTANVNRNLIAYCMTKCARALGKNVTPRTVFLRLTCDATDTAPHQAHNDEAMGEYTFLLYWQNGPGGTALVRHTSGDDLTHWERDTNVYDAWEEYDRVDMARNRAVMFDSKLMHRAEPVHGFGESATNGRIVLTIFFDTQE